MTGSGGQQKGKEMGLERRRGQMNGRKVGRMRIWRNEGIEGKRKWL